MIKKLTLMTLLSLLILMLTACSQRTTLKIMVPSGSPALSQIYIQENTDEYEVDIVNGADPLVAAFASNSHDIIFAPTNLGAKLYQSGMDYLFAGTVVWGNYYLIAKGKITFDMEHLQNQNIIVFGQNQTSDIILKYLLEESLVTATITYVDSVATATAMFMADPSLIVMVAEPSLSSVESKVADLQIIDLQNVYETITGEDSYPQAGVFVSKTLSKTQVNLFLRDLKRSIEQINDDPEAAGITGETLEIGFTAAIIAAAIPTSHLDYRSAIDSKNALEAYFQLILDRNAALIGGALPDESFYYRP